MAQRHSPTRVLLIDDDEMSRELFVVLLQAEGYAVSSADSGEAALQLLESSTRPDLVLTDMQMPGSTPDQLAGRLRRACGRGTILLAMSGTQPTPLALTHYDGFLLKPFGVTELAAVIGTAQAARTTKKISAVAIPVKSVRNANNLPRPKANATLALAASAEEPASNRNMAKPHSSAPSGNAPVLDEAIYRQLAASMPASQLHEMYDMCITDARSRIASMRILAATHDSVQFMREAHAIKGSCGMLGAAELHRITAALEKNGPDPGGSAVNSLDELSHACDRLERMLSSRA